MASPTSENRRNKGTDLVSPSVLTSVITVDGWICTTDAHWACTAFLFAKSECVAVFIQQWQCCTRRKSTPVSACVWTIKHYQQDPHQLSDPLCSGGRSSGTNAHLGLLFSSILQDGSAWQWLIWACCLCVSAAHLCSMHIVHLQLLSCTSAKPFSRCR